MEATAEPVEMGWPNIIVPSTTEDVIEPVTSSNLMLMSSMNPSTDQTIDEPTNNMQDTTGMAEVLINNLDQVCNARAAVPFFGVGLGQLFGITVVFSTTVTSTSTITSTATTFAQTNTFVISLCTPSPFPFTTCTNSG